MEHRTISCSCEGKMERIGSDELLAWLGFLYWEWIDRWLGFFNHQFYFLKSHVQNLEFQSSASTQLIRLVLDALYCAYFSKCEFQILSESVRCKLNGNASKFCYFI